jgi:hypothetical protein
MYIAIFMRTCMHLHILPQGPHHTPHHLTQKKAHISVCSKRVICYTMQTLSRTSSHSQSMLPAHACSCI